MRRSSRLVPVLTVLAVLLAGLPAAIAATSGPRVAVDEEIRDAVGDTSALVHVAADASVASARTAAADAGLRPGSTYDAIRVFVAYGDTAAFDRLAGSGLVTYLEYNRPIELLTDTSHGATRGEEVLDGAVTMPDGSTIDGAGVGVAIVDSGVDGTHPDLAERLGKNVRIVCSAPGGGVAVGVPGGGFSECRGPKTALELEDTDTPAAGGHGTHVAGITAGDGTGSDGTYHGAAPGATWYGVGVGTSLVVENALDGLAWVLENHDQVEPAIRVVNNSWGSGYEEYDPDSNFYSATHKLIEALIADGVTVVFAAGNSGGDGSSATTSAQCVNPTPGLICVANYDDENAGTRDGSIDSTSSRGEDGNASSYPDISAPGTQIMSTCRITLPVCSAHGSPATDNLYAELSGTSMAAPHVTGIVAQLLQANPDLTPADIESLLEETAYEFDFGAEYEADPANSSSQTSHDKGHGLVDVVAAAEAALGSASGDTTGTSGATNGEQARSRKAKNATGKGLKLGKSARLTADAGPPTNFIAEESSLSQPEYAETVRDVHRVPMADGVELYVEVVRPDPEAHGEGPWPVIMEASPYHGTSADRSGTRIFPDPVDEDGAKIGLTGYFGPRGYAVAIVDLRGTGRSGGCLDHLGPNDASDLKTIVEWAASQPWSTGRVGMTGHSYVGSTPSIAAAQNPEGLATIVPSAGLASMYDHQFNKGVPWLLQWVGPMVAYEQLALERHAPGGDDFGNNPQDTGCGLQNSSLVAGTGQVTGQYEAWHAERDHGEGAAAADIPVFMIHGVNDNAARIPAAEWFFGGRFDREQDKVWIGQWDHGSTNGRCGDEQGARVLHPTCRFDQFKYALHAWFDKHLKGVDVDTGPAVEAFLNGEQPIDVTQVVDPETMGGKVLTADSWSAPDATVALYPDASDMSLGTAPPAEDASASFSAPLDAVAAHAGGNVEFVSEPLTEDTVFLGLPQLQLHASVTNSQVAHLVTTLFREDADGNREPVNFCGIQAQLREGVETLTPVVPGEEMALPMQCFTAAHWVPAGQRLVLQVATSSPHHASFGSEQEINVHTGPEKTAHTLPVVNGAVLHDDVPLRESTGDAPGADIPVGPAQPPVEGDVVVPLSGAGVVRQEPVTDAPFEFDVLEGYDNASFEALATPALPADLDLYLQKQAADGTWGDDLTAAETGSLEEEVLTFGRLTPGRYRIVVHNWSGAPTTVHLELTFYNQEGVAGTEGGDGSPTTAAVEQRLLLPLP